MSLCIYKNKKYTHETSPTIGGHKSRKRMEAQEKNIYRICEAVNKRSEEKIYTVSFIFHFYYDVLTPRSTCWLIIIFHMIMLRFFCLTRCPQTPKFSFIKASHAFNYYKTTLFSEMWEEDWMRRCERRIFYCEHAVKIIFGDSLRWVSLIVTWGVLKSYSNKCLLNFNVLKIFKFSRIF